MSSFRGAPKARARNPEVYVGSRGPAQGYGEGGARPHINRIGLNRLRGAGRYGDWDGWGRCGVADEVRRSAWRGRAELAGEGV